MNARYYVPGIARFASADTIVPKPTNPQSFNRYTYVGNRPLSLVDPTGHVAEETNEANSCGILVCGLNPYEHENLAGYGNYSYEQIVLLKLLWLDHRGIEDELIRNGLYHDLSFVARGDYDNMGAAGALFATSPDTFKGTILETLIDPDLLVGFGYAMGAVIGGGPGSGGNNDINVSFGVDELLEGASPGRPTKGRTTNWEKQGGFAQAERDFDALSLNDVTDIPGVGKRGTLPNGDTVVLRYQSTYGTPNIEVQGRRYTKIRYEP